jgi:co-chaperonin GroES (HSP10)
MATINELLNDLPWPQCEIKVISLKPDAVRFRPVLDRILVEEIPIEENRIVLPGGVKLERSERYTEKSDLGRVLAVGDGVPMGGILMPMPYKAGQIVKCSEYGRRPWYARPEDKNDKSIPKRYLIRVADTLGEQLV